MNFKKTVVALTFLGLGTSGITMANSMDIGNSYISLQLGYGGIASKSYNGFTKKNNGFSYRVAGGYLFNVTDNFKVGPEIGYLHYPEAKYSASGINIIQLEGYSLDLLINAQYNFNKQWYGFAKAGLAYTHQKTTFHNPDDATENGNATKSKLLPEAAAGMGYKINQNMSIDVSYHRIFGKTDPLKASSLNDVKVGAVNAWLIGFNYNF